MKLATLLALPFTLSVCGLAEENVHPDWQIVEVGAGTKPSFDFGIDDKIHVMGMTEDLSGVVWYAEAATVEGPWNPSIIAEGYFYGPGDIRVDRNTDDAHVAWHDHDIISGSHVVIGANGTRQTFILESDGHDGWDNSLTIAPSGMVYLASVDPSGFGAQNSLQYGTFDGNSWTFESTIAGSGSFMYGLNTSIALDTAEQPHVLFCQSGDWIADGSLVLGSAGSPAWSFETVTTGTGTGRFPTLAIDSNNRMHATWLDIDPETPNLGTIQYGTRAAEGQPWMIAPVATLDSVIAGFSDARKSASVALDSSGNPHIAFSDTATIQYAQLQNGSWLSTPVAANGDKPYKSLVVLRLDSNDQPGIAFWQSDDDGDTVRIARPASTTNPVASVTIDLGLTVAPQEGSTQIRFHTRFAGSYQIQWSDDLEIWNPLGDPHVSDATVEEVKSNDPAARAFRYYRVVTREA